MAISTEKLDISKLKTPTGTTLTCKGWIQEAALRMLHNNLDPEVAERPEDLIVYGGTGKAARNPEAFHLIVKALKALEEDETLVIQSGKGYKIKDVLKFIKKNILHWENDFDV